MEDNIKKENFRMRILLLCIICTVFIITGVFIFKDAVTTSVTGTKASPDESFEVVTKSSVTEGKAAVASKEDRAVSSAALKDKQATSGSAVSDKTTPSSISGKSAASPGMLDDVTGSIPDGFFANCLFIGDSRTVGLREYGGMTGATFFCDTGMSVYKLDDATCSYDDVGTVTLAQLLEKKDFDRIYFMTGINAVGYKHDSMMKKYTAFAEMMAAAQPDAQICICANLHVSKAKSDSDNVINNPSLNDLNSRMEQLADSHGYVYIDCNSVFDDSTGSLCSDYSGDGVHPTAAYYKKWAVWLANCVNY